MKILYIVPSIDISRGGPSYSTVDLCHALSREGLDVTMFTCKPLGEVPPLTGKGFSVKYFSRTWPVRYANSNDLINEIYKVGHLYDIVDITSLWNFTSSRAASAVLKIGKHYVLSPHGMLSAWDRGIKSLHKELFYMFIHKKQVQKANLLRYLTIEEATASSSVTCCKKHAIVSNGIWPEEYSALDPTIFRKKYNLDNRRIVSFLGRLNKIKRLDLQCDAFKILATKFSDLYWAFIGPDDGMGDFIKQEMAGAGLLNRFIMPGLLTGKDKLSALAATSVYCHTSDHEGHSMAITEALASGIPCVITKGCHFDKIETEKAGFVTAPDPTKIAKAIETILNCSKNIEDMGNKARNMAFENYSWPKIASQMIDVYKWVLGQGDKPDCVRLD